MKKITFSSNDTSQLSKFAVSDDVTNSESELYRFTMVDGARQRKDYLFKKLYNLGKEILSNKIFSITALNKLSMQGDLKEFVIPEYLVYDDGGLIGFLLLEQKNTTTLGTVLKGAGVSKSVKLSLLKRVGDIVEKAHSFEYEGLPFCFGDLHENNFLVNSDGDISVVDLDSSTFHNMALSSYYLIDNPNLDDFSKYEFNVFGIPFPNRDTDLLCYNMMLLSTIAEENMNVISVPEYFGYLDYLSTLGFSEDFLDSFKRVYSNHKNENASSFLESVPDEILERAAFRFYRENVRSK